MQTVCEMKKFCWTENSSDYYSKIWKKVDVKKTEHCSNTLQAKHLKEEGDDTMLYVQK